MHKQQTPCNLSHINHIQQLSKKNNFKVDRMNIKGLSLDQHLYWKACIFIAFKSLIAKFTVFIVTFSVVFFLGKENDCVGIKIMGAHFIFQRNYFFFKKNLKLLSRNGVFLAGETKETRLLFPNIMKEISNKLIQPENHDIFELVENKLAFGVVTKTSKFRRIPLSQQI